MALAARFVSSQGDYAERGGAGATWDYNAAYTICGWVYAVSFVAAGGGIFQPQLDANNTDTLFIDSSSPNSMMKLLVKAASSGTSVNAVDLVVAKWTHLAVVRENNASLKLFVNGAASESAVRTQSVAGRSAATFLTFGYLSDTRMAYLRVHTAALTQAERVAEMWSPLAQKATGLWADWPLQSHASNIFPDVSGNARDLPFGTESGSGVPAFEAGPVLSWGAQLSNTHNRLVQV